MEAFLGWEEEFIEKSRGTMTVPFHIDNVTKEILTAELRANGTIDNKTTVKSFNHKLIKNSDDKYPTPENGRLGVLSCIFRLFVTYEGGDGPPSMIYKVIPLMKEFFMLRGVLKIFRAWEIECKAYNRKHPFTEIPVPKGYFAVYDPEAYRYQILMEDLSNRSLKCGNVSAGLNDNQVDVAMSIFEGVAKMHAKFWNKTYAFNC